MNIRKYYLYLPTLIITILLIVITINSFAQNNLEEIKILLKNGKYVRAEKLISNSIEINPNNPELLFYKGIIETNIGKNDKAINTFRNLTEKFPELPEPFNNLAVLYAGAARAAGRLREASPHSPTVRQFESRSLFRDALHEVSGSAVNPNLPAARRRNGTSSKTLSTRAVLRARTSRPAQRKAALAGHG